MPVKKRRRVAAEDLYALELISANSLSPDGKLVVYCRHWVDRKTEKKYANLWLVSTEGGAPRRFTRGDQADTSPKWSPDGRSVAFLSNRKDGKTFQIHVIPVDGGEARRVTDMKGTFKAFEWSPDGKSFAASFQKTDAEVLEREKDEEKKKLGVVSRHITRTFFKFDGTGYLPKERTHLWVIEAGTGRAVQITKGDIHDEDEPAWSPDGKRIAFVSNRTPDPDMHVDEVDIFTVARKGGPLKKIATQAGMVQSPRYSPDGKWIAYYGTDGIGEWWRNTNLFVTRSDGKGKARNVTGSFDVHVSAWTINDVGFGPPMSPPTWSKYGSTIYFQAARHGDTTLRSVSLTDKTPRLRTDITGPGAVGMFDFDKEFTKLAYFKGTMADPGQIFVQETETGRTRKLTNLNAGLLASRDLGTIEEVWFKGAAGNKLQGWILKPPGFDPRKKYPSILQIHGGPLVQYGNYFFHEFYFLAAHGYVVYFSNPRGGQGYGERHSKAIHKAWGTVDYEDLMAWADFVARKPYIDAKRMGVTGGSYGGFMTNWIIGHTRRFKAAVTQRCVSNMVSMWGSSDLNWVFQQELADGPPWSHHAQWWRQSPMKHIGGARTPTLVIHSESDHRCDIEQGEQIYVSLKRLGVDTELVRFPDEPHGLSRGGRTDRRIVRLNHILRWFDKYLK